MVYASDCNPSEVPAARTSPSIPPSVSSKFSLHVPILMYHRVVWRSMAGKSNASLVVPPNKFQAQMDALRKAGWHTITLAQLADDLAAGVTPAPRTFVITIDDGWSDGYVFAWPILHKEGFVATYFVIAGRIDKSSSFLSSEEIRYLEAAGNEIGDHTLDHLTLTRLKARRVMHEVDSGAATLAAVLGHWPETFAYPDGKATAGVGGIVRACQGMKMGVIEGQGTLETWANRFATPRLKVRPGTGPVTLLSWVQHPWLPAPKR